MDGSNAGFLFELPEVSCFDAPGFETAGFDKAGFDKAGFDNGSFSTIDFDTVKNFSADILYMEDFDAPLAPLMPEIRLAEHESEPFALTQDDIDAAWHAGRQEGLAAALGEASLVQQQLATAAMQAVADGLSISRNDLSRVAGAQADETSRILLGILQAALPAAMAAHGAADVTALVHLLLPGLACEPALKVRTHPELADNVRELLAGHLAPETALTVAADAALAPGDVTISWSEGRATRDARALWKDICVILAPLRLPALEDICCAK